MSRQIDLAALWRLARRQALADPIDGLPPGPVVEDCPFVLTDLILPDPDDLPDVAASAARLQGGA